MQWPWWSLRAEVRELGLQHAEFVAPRATHHPEVVPALLLVVPACGAECFEPLDLSFHVVGLDVEVHPFFVCFAIGGGLKQDANGRVGKKELLVHRAALGIQRLLSGAQWTLEHRRRSTSSRVSWRGTLTVAQDGAADRREFLVDDPKSEASDATVPLPKITRRDLLAHRDRQDKGRIEAGEDVWQDHGLVFPTSVGTPIGPRSLNRHFDGIRTRAGLPGVQLHDLMHTVVTLLLELRTPPHVVQAIARHADLDVTLAIYAHPNLDAMSEALDKIDWKIG